MVTFASTVTVFEALVKAVPATYVPLTLIRLHAPGAPVNVYTAGGGAGKKVIEKLQLLAPRLTGNKIVPELTGVPVPVSTTICGPNAIVPEPEKVQPFVAVVVIE